MDTINSVWNRDEEQDIYTSYCIFFQKLLTIEGKIVTLQCRNLGDTILTRHQG